VPGVSRELLPRLVEMRNSGFTVAVMIIDNEANFAHGARVCLRRRVSGRST
jgi:hypothetical protein